MSNILWIPPGRWPGECEVRDNIMVLGSASGRMTLLSFELGVNLSGCHLC